MRPHNTVLGIVHVYCLIILSCSKGGPGPSGHVSDHRLSTFSVTVIDRASYSAILQWSAVAPLSAGDTVKYNVRLNNRMVDSNLLRLTDTIRSLSPDSTYSGRVYAFTRSGDTISAPFFLDQAVGFVYFGDDADNVNCLNLYTGGVIWSRNLGGVFGLLGVPVVVNNVLYINDPVYGTWAFNAATGQTIWNSFYTGGISSYAESGPLWVNGTIYTAMPGGICALNGNTGALIWSLNLNDGYYVNPVMAGNRLIAATSGGEAVIVAIDPATGTKVWSDSLKTQVGKNPVVYGSLVIFTGLDGKIYALKVADGSPAWSRDFSVSVDNYGGEFTSPVLYHDLVIIYNGNTGYYGLNAANGSTVWNYQASIGPASSPAVGSDRVFFTSNSWLIALDAATGALDWRKPVSNIVNGSSLICVRNRLYLHCQPNSAPFGAGLEAFYAPTGDSVDFVYNNYSVWSYETIVSKDTTYYITESGMLQ